MYRLKPKKCTAAKFFFGLLSSLSFNFSQTGSFFRAQLCKSCGAMFRLQVSSRYLQIKLYFVPGSCQAPFTEFYVFEVYVPIFIFREENVIMAKTWVTFPSNFYFRPQAPNFDPKSFSKWRNF